MIAPLSLLPILAMTLLAHYGQYLIGQFNPAEYIGFKLRAYGIARQVFHRTRHAKTAVIEQRIQLATGCLQYFCNGGFN